MTVNLRTCFALWASLCALLVILVFAGCSGEPSGRPTPSAGSHVPSGALRIDSEGEPGGTLEYCLSGEINSFNYVTASDARTQLVTHLTTGTLLEFDPSRQEVVGGIARDWEVSDDSRVVLLTLREGVKFSDGHPVTSAEVLFTFEKLYEEGSTNHLAGGLQVAGKPLTAEVTGEGQIRIVFPEVYAAAELMLASIPVLPAHLLKEPGRKIEEYWNLSTPAGEMAGLGPFVVQEHVPGEKTVLGRNPHYWKVDAEGRQLPYLDQLVVHYIGDRNSQLLRFQSGYVDLLDYQLRAEDFVQLKEVSGDARLVNAGPSTHLTFFFFNQNSGTREDGRPILTAKQRSWFGNVNFRRAVSAAVSREAIAENVYLGQASPTWTLMPASLPDWYLDKKPEAIHDFKYARELLREAGFGWKRSGTSEVLVDPEGREVRFSLVTIADDVWGRIAALVQNDLEQIGIQVSIRQEEFGSVISRVMGSKDYDVALLGLLFPDEPADHMSMLLSSGPQHFWNLSQESPETEWERRIDELMLRQVSTLDQTERRALYREVQQILMDKVPIVPLINKDALVAAAGRVHNLRPVIQYPNALWNAWELWVEEK